MVVERRGNGFGTDQDPLAILVSTSITRTTTERTSTMMEKGRSIPSSLSSSSSSSDPLPTPGEMVVGRRAVVGAPLEIGAVC